MAWALRIGFVIALVVGLWLARPREQAPGIGGEALDQVESTERQANPREEPPEPAEGARSPASTGAFTPNSNPPAEPSAEVDTATREADRSQAGGAPDESNSADSIQDAEVVATLERIEAGGPFPFRQDDTVFMNREGRLPKRPLGYYREFTVNTPGADDRGPRRIVRGEQGELYFTEDHYRSFVPLDPSHKHGRGNGRTEGNSQSGRDRRPARSRSP